MTDAEFLQAIQSEAHSSEFVFGHAEHIRLGWLLCRQHTKTEAINKVRSAIQHLAQSQGASTLYHETITRFWVEMITLAIAQTPALTDFTAFRRQHPYLFEKTFIQAYYSDGCLKSEQARHTWVEPDIRPLSLAD